MLVTLFGIVIVVSEVQPPKAEPPMLVTPFGSTKYFVSDCKLEMFTIVITAFPPILSGTTRTLWP